MREVRERERVGQSVRERKSGKKGERRIEREGVWTQSCHSMLQAGIQKCDISMLE